MFRKRFVIKSLSQEVDRLVHFNSFFYEQTHVLEKGCANFFFFFFFSIRLLTLF